MKTIVFVIVLLFSVTSYAGEYTVRPRHHDFNPNDGFMDPGSYTNPLIITDDHGIERGRLRPRHYDLNPNDGFLDQGTQSNPYIIETY